MTERLEIHVASPDLRIEAVLPASPGQTLLICLTWIQRSIDGRLGLRSNCGTGQCGICAVRVDGHPQLACRVQVRPGQCYLVEPIDESSHLQGLVCDISAELEGFFADSGKRDELTEKSAFETLLCRPNSAQD